jgi:phosphatidylglycerol:prolipoprotein diacylglycerol transferase
MYPILFTIPKIGSIGPTPVHTFGVMMVLAFTAAMWLAKSRAPRFGVDGSKIMDASFWMLVAGVFGARIVFILQELPYYLKHTDELFSFRFEGLTSFGGLIFGLLALILWAKKEKLPLQTTFDIVAPAFLVGHIFGRIGCLLNGCCYGGVCPESFPFATKFVGVPGFHQPAQIYDALMNVVALGAILLVERRGLRSGQATSLVFVGYGLARFIYEFWRAGTPDEVSRGLASSTTIGTLPITEAQVMAGFLVVAGLVWFVLARRNRPEFTPVSPESSTGAQEPLPA